MRRVLCKLLANVVVLLVLGGVAIVVGVLGCIYAEARRRRARV